MYKVLFRITTLKSALNDLEVIYNSGGVTLTRNNRTYELRFQNVLKADFSTAMNTIKSYFPSTLYNTVFTRLGDVHYHAEFTYTSNTNAGVSIVGTYGNTPTDYTTTSHALYGNITWIK